MYEPDSNLIKRIQSGDTNAFEQIVNKYKDRAMTLMVRILKDRDDAEDALQEAFIKTYNAVSKSQFEERARFSTYFYRIVYNTAIDHYKKLRKVDYRLDDSDTFDLETKIEYETLGSGSFPRTESYVLDGEIQNLVNTYLDRLPEKYSVILTMFYINDLSHDEICRTLDLPIGTVKNRIFRAKEKLKEIILKNYSLEDMASLTSF